jgi:DNA-binding transcriptional regulator LsrR (DeoR family)
MFESYTGASRIKGNLLFFNTVKGIAYGEKVTILKIAKIANVNKNSANKYLKQAREEGIV